MDVTLSCKTLIGGKTMQRKMITAMIALLSAVTLAADPKVGCTISFIDNHNMYRNNSLFRTRPIAEQMIKDGVDLCLYKGWGNGDAVKSLKQFNAIWLITEHEGMCQFKPEVTAEALKSYVEDGGGLVFCFSAGRYPEAAVDAYWTKVMNTFGAEILHEEIFNPETEVKVDKCRNMFYTSDLIEHPVTKGIPGLWLADRSGGTWGSVAVKYSPEWTVVVTGGKGSKSIPKNRRTNEIELGKEGFYTHDAPIVAVREFGKGRVVFIASHKDTCGWMYGCDKWPNYPERSVYNGKPSDMVGLVENALKWAGAPSAGDPSFVKHYQPVEVVPPPYDPQPDFCKHELETLKYSALQPATRKIGARGVVGVHSSYSDGKSSVAEYVAAAKAAGLNFLVFTDPLEFLTAEKLASLRDDCAANSTNDFYCCPGVEYTDSSDCEWALWHDKVEFPDPKPFLRDGRYYTMFDGKKILQRNQYGGHQNLYRGVLLNMKHVEDIGNDLINLAYFNAIAPKVFDEGKLIFDNNPQYLKVGHNLHRAATVSFTRVRNAADIAMAAKTGVTCGDSITAIREWANAKGGWGGQGAGEMAHIQAVYGAGVEILGFDFARSSGSDIYRIAVHAACPAGVEEVAVLDGNRRILARFNAHGEKDFSATFDYLHDRQAVLIMTAKGCDGSEAVSNSKWIYYYHAGLFRCGDNSNLLSQNPNMICFLNWDDTFVPPFKKLTRRPGVVRNHQMVSEAILWSASYTIPSRFPTAGCWGERSKIQLRGTSYPSEQDGMPSSHTVSTLNAPNVVSIVDQDFGEYVMEPTRNDKNATYSMCSPVKKISDGKYWRRHHRVYQFVDRHDGWWVAVHGVEAPDYRGGYTVVEGEIVFTEDVELADSIELVRLTASHPSKPVMVFKRNAEKFNAGSYYSVVSDDSAWYAVFGLEGSDDLLIRETPQSNGMKTSLMIGNAGLKFKKDDKLTYRFAVGSFCEPIVGGQYLEWFARMMNGEGFNHVAKKGEIKGVNGIVDVTAENYEAAIALGSTWFVQNYPVRITGLVDNGSAVVLDDNGKIFRPLGFAAGCGLVSPESLAVGGAYAEVPLEVKRTWRFMNLYVADDPAIRFCVVPSMPGHEKETVEIHNPTTRDIKTKVRDIRSGNVFEIEIKAGETAVEEAFKN